MYSTLRVIAFSGAQNTGKTTQMIAYAKSLQDKGFKVQVGYKLPEGAEGSISRRSKKLGFGINEESSFDSQYHIMLSYLLSDIETRKQAEKDGVDWIVYDRSVMDHLPYANKVCNGEEYFMLEDMSNQHRQRYPIDFTVYCFPVPFEEDGDRSISQEFQNEIVEIFDTIMPQPDVRLPNVSIKERIDLLDRYLEIPM